MFPGPLALLFYSGAYVRPICPNHVGRRFGVEPCADLLAKLWSIWSGSVRAADSVGFAAVDQLSTPKVFLLNLSLMQP